MTLPRLHAIAIPGALADFLNEEGTSGAQILSEGQVRRVQRGRGYSLIVDAPLEVHIALVAAAWPLAAEGAESSASERRAFRKYDRQVAELRKQEVSVPVAQKELAFPTPAFEDIGEREMLVHVTGKIDREGRVQFTAFWRGTDALRLGKVRAQVFFTDLEKFIQREAVQGWAVRQV